MIRNCRSVSINLLKFNESASNRSMSSQRDPICNFAFIDLETTGLPSLENNKTKITELSITIVKSSHLRMGVYPRVRNKLHLCLNPCKFISPDATSLTGLSNDLLEHQSPFSSDIVSQVNNFLNLFKKPICFVAHNGLQFDYPILKAEINNVCGQLIGDILCIDSLKFFQDLHKKENSSESSTQLRDESGSSSQLRAESGSPTAKKLKTSEEIPLEFTDGFDQILCTALDEFEESEKRASIQKKNETTPIKQIKSRKSLNMNSIQNYFPTAQKRPRVSFKLEEVYKRLYSKDPDTSHHAEGDVDCLIHCAAKHGEYFVEWANENAKLFAEIPPMRPGVRIGSWK